jgi:hypothetical protein
VQCSALKAKVLSTGAKTRSVSRVGSELEPPLKSSAVQRLHPARLRMRQAKARLRNAPAVRSEGQALKKATARGTLPRSERPRRRTGCTTFVRPATTDRHCARSVFTTPTCSFSMRRLRRSTVRRSTTSYKQSSNCICVGRSWSLLTAFQLSELATGYSCSRRHSSWRPARTTNGLAKVVSSGELLSCTERVEAK